jgi:hypothetical protein
LDDEGGGNNDKVSWSVTFTRSGSSTTMVKSVTANKAAARRRRRRRAGTRSGLRSTPSRQTEVIRGVVVPVPTDMPLGFQQRMNALRDSDRDEDVQELVALIFGPGVLDSGSTTAWAPASSASCAAGVSPTAAASRPRSVRRST